MFRSQQALNASPIPSVDLGALRGDRLARPIRQLFPAGRPAKPHISLIQLHISAIQLIPGRLGQK